MKSHQVVVLAQKVIEVVPKYISWETIFVLGLLCLLIIPANAFLTNIVNFIEHVPDTDQEKEEHKMSLQRLRSGATKKRRDY